MPFAQLDDHFHAHPRVQPLMDQGILGLAAQGLFVRAISYCADYLTDGRVDRDWLHLQVRRRGGPKVIRALLDVGLLEDVSDAYMVRDYLQYNESRAHVMARRERDRRRKAGAGLPAGPGNSSAIPPGIRAGISEDSSGISRARGVWGSEVQQAVKENGSVDARELPGVVSEIIGILEQSPRVFVDVVGVENAIAAWPKRNHAQAARTVVTWVTDPAFRVTNGAKLLFDALSKQPAPPEEAPLDERTKRRRRNSQALRDLQAKTGTAAA